jgi:gliding motility-associated-like protein
VKKLFFLYVCLICLLPASARHVAGGELFYEYLGFGNTPGTSNYKITLRLFRDCQSSGPLLESETVIVGIYSNDNGALMNALTLPRISAVTSIALNTADFPCLVGNVSVCYEIGIFSATIQLNDNINGYTLSRIGCCRVDRISNLSQPSSVGSNYVTRIPGTATLPDGHNNSPQFIVKDTALVCANKPFQLDFSAGDFDRDSLSYSFCAAFTSTGGTNSTTPPQILSLTPLPYAPPFSGSSPLGARVSIDPRNGIISGIAPPEGQYVVNVCITEWRKGKAFTEHRKDFILKVQNCDFIEADLPEKIVNCSDFTVKLENQSTSSAITSYTWSLGDPAGTVSSAATVNFTYPDTGTYRAKLTVTGPKGCVGSDSTLVLVYPGFKAGFSVTGNCYFNPYQFRDTSYAKYGTVNRWQWDFGDDSTAADTSNARSAVYKYGVVATHTVKLTASSSKGCIDSALTTIQVSDKPVVRLPFRDTLICSIDTLAIPVSNTGNISWLPNKNIINANTNRPLVFPKDTTHYFVTVNDNGCINTDTVTVNVLPFIRVKLGKDTIICASDTVRLNPVSQALQYQWISSTGVTVSAVKNPLVQPRITTRYVVIANLGRCEARDSVEIKTVPYPAVQLGNDTTICFGSRIQLNATIKASSFNWLPQASLINTGGLRPLAGPNADTRYILRVTDTLGCPKPAYDTILVKVAPAVKAFAGNDTFAIPLQPVQLYATGGLHYRWTPESGLDNPRIQNPVTILDVDMDSVRYKVRVSDDVGCSAEDDIVIRNYKNGPDIIIPSAFTPNGDGRNDVLRPLTVGINELLYFRVYSRWGELIFSSKDPGRGWDGTFKGVQQPASTYVYMAEGTDFTGKRIFRKGTAVLIR